jgi:hypothetical protein
VPQSTTSSYGGGAIFAEGGQLKVVNSAFLDNRCYQYGPDLGGAAIRAYGMYMASPVYITDDTFTGNTCSNGAALSGLYANFDVTDSLLTGNKAIGWGANPAQAGTPTATTTTWSSTAPSCATTAHARAAERSSSWSTPTAAP